jgi:hypothetical protein
MLRLGVIALLSLGAIAGFSSADETITLPSKKPGAVPEVRTVKHFQKHHEISCCSAEFRQEKCCGIGCDCGACGTGCQCDKAARESSKDSIPAGEARQAPVEFYPLQTPIASNCHCGPQCGCAGKAGGRCPCHDSGSGGGRRRFRLRSDAEDYQPMPVMRSSGGRRCSS